MGMYCNLLSQPTLPVCLHTNVRICVLPNEVIHVCCVRDRDYVAFVHYSTSVIISHSKSQQAPVP